MDKSIFQSVEIVGVVNCGKSGKALFVHVNPQRVQTRNQNIHPKIEFPLIYQQRIINILLHHSLLMVNPIPDFKNIVREKNSFSLWGTSRFTDVDFGVMTNIFLWKKREFLGKDIGFGHKIKEPFSMSLCHIRKIPDQIVLFCNLNRFWKVIYLLIRRHILEHLCGHASATSENRKIFCVCVLKAVFDKNWANCSLVRVREGEIVAVVKFWCCFFLFLLSLIIFFKDTNLPHLRNRFKHQIPYNIFIPQPLLYSWTLLFPPHYLWTLLFPPHFFPISALNTLPLLLQYLLIFQTLILMNHLLIAHILHILPLSLVVNLI